MVYDRKSKILRKNDLRFSMQTFKLNEMHAKCVMHFCIMKYILVIKVTSMQ